MKIINACASAMNPHLARSAVFGTGQKPELVRLHPAQVCAISMLYETVAIESIKDLGSLEDIDAVRHLAKDYEPLTFMGIKIKRDPTMRPDQVEFLDATGGIIGRIECLAIPNGFEQPT
jgi:hypothetical protein